MRSSRRYPDYWAFIGHRLSGVALALFLPVHFHVLGMALHEGERLDALLAFTEIGLVKVAEAVLVLLLSLHLIFGLRLLALEIFPWRSPTSTRESWIGWGAAISLMLGTLYLAGVF